MQWEKPSFVEVTMNAEIGSYQSDFAVSEEPPRDRVEGDLEEERPAREEG
jgi:hypothetical protein